MAVLSLLLMDNLKVEQAVRCISRQSNTQLFATGVEAFSDIGMDDVLSNDDWDDPEAEAAAFIQARLQNQGGVGSTDSPPPPREGMRLQGVQSPPNRLHGQDVIRNGHPGGPQKLVQSGVASEGRVESARQPPGPKRPLPVVLAEKETGAGQEGHNRTSHQVEIEIVALETGPVEVAIQSRDTKASKAAPGKQAGGAQAVPGPEKEIELCSVEEPLRSPDASEQRLGRAAAKQHEGRQKGRAHQGVSHADNEREGSDSSSNFHSRTPHHRDLEAGLSGESQGEDDEGEWEAEPMLPRDGPETSDTWHFLPKKVVDLGRRFGEGEEVPWQHAREDTPFSEQDAEFEVFRERGRRWTRSGERDGRGTSQDFLR